MTAPAPATDLPVSPVGRALGHVVLAGVLGIVAGIVGTPLLGASLFGGWPAVLVAAVTAACLSSAGAAALDRVAGPGALGRPGSVLRGVVVGGLGSTVAMAVALWVLQSTSDVADVLPVPLRFAAAAVPFAVLAALQWPGVVRLVAAVLLVAGTAVVVVPGGMRAAAQQQDGRILTEVGTLEHPWVSELDGYRVGPSQATGSPLIWTDLEPAGPGRDAVSLYRDDAVDPASRDDLCGAPWLWTSEDTATATACAEIGDGLWLRTYDVTQELLRLRADVRIGVTASPEVPLDVLEAALAAARPMTDDEYERWLDEGLTPGW